jgi:hypothetical protein
LERRTALNFAKRRFSEDVAKRKSSSKKENLEGGARKSNPGLRY